VRHLEVEAAEFEAEQPARDLSGTPKLIISVGAVAVSLYALFWVVRPQPAQPYRTSFLAITLAMTLLAYRPLARRDAAPEEERKPGDDNPGPLDWALAALALVALLYPLLVFDDFARRVVRPTGLDVVLGVVAVLLVLEATRRTVGWVLPAICLGFVAYAMLGGLLPFGWELGHKGYDLERLVGQAYMGIEGLFGVPLDVAATYIVLFTIYGAVLEYSGAGRFFIDVSFAAFGTRAAGSCRRPGSGPSRPRRPLARPPSSSPSSWRSPTSRSCCSPPSRRCCTTWASSWRPSRWTAAATAPAASTSRPGRWAGCCCATATTSAR
jgi:TRAP-type uncharacterized transport system fused permease subunit